MIEVLNYLPHQISQYSSAAISIPFCEIQDKYPNKSILFERDGVGIWLIISFLYDGNFIGFGAPKKNTDDGAFVFSSSEVSIDLMKRSIGDILERSDVQIILH